MNEDVILKLIYDDSQAVEGLTKLYGAIGKTEAGFDDLQKSTKELNTVVGKDLVKANQDAERSLDNVIKKTVQGSSSLEKQKTAIQETAIAILKSGDAASKFAALMERVSKVKMSGTASDVNDLEKEFTELLQTVKLTDDQMIVLENNIDEVAQVIGSLSSNEFIELANDAKETTGEFFNAKRELRELTKLINSGQLTGDELKQAEIRAAELTDTIGDTQLKLKLLASDTRGFDLTVEAISGLSAGFQIFEGAAALAGDESEDFQKTLVKLNAVMAIANGVQQTANILTTKGGIATTVAAGAQALYTTVVGGSTGALKLFRIALASTGIGLIVILLGSLIANFDEVKKKTFEWIPGLEKLGSVFAGIKNSIVSFFSDFGNIFANIFSGDFSKAYDQFKNIGSNARKAFDEGFDNNESQKAKDKIAQDLEDLAKSQRKRAELLAAAGKENTEIIKNATANELAALKLRGEDREKIEEKAFELQKLQIEKQKKLEEERRKLIEDYTNRFKKSIDEIQQLSAEFGLLSEKEQFDIVKQKTIEQFKNLRSELILTGKALNKDFGESLKNIDQLISGIEAREFVPESIEKLPTITEKKIKETQKVISQNPITIPPPQFASGGEDDGLTSLFNKIIEDVDGFEKLIDNIFFELFNLPPGAGEEFIKGINTFIGELGAALNEVTELQLDSIDKQIDRISERRAKVEDELEKELELQKEGLANNVGNKQAEVDGLLAQEERLTREREEIQREAQRRQIIADTITQTQGLITSSIDIIKGFSKIPIIGLPLGIAAVATLFGFFASTKAKALAATRLYKGANRISDHFGEAVPNGRTDIPGRGEGYRLVDAVTGEDMNTVISGREMLLPESVTASQREFFNNLMAGKYNEIDIAKSLDFSKKQTRSIKPVQSTVIVNVPKKQYVTFRDKKGRYGAKLMDIPDSGSEIIYFDL